MHDLGDQDQLTTHALAGAYAREALRREHENLAMGRILPFLPGTYEKDGFDINLPGLRSGHEFAPASLNGC